MKHQALFSIPRESAALQRIHMKHQALFSLKDKRKIIKTSSAAFCALRVNLTEFQYTPAYV